MLSNSSNAILNGFDEIPPIDEKIREGLNQQFKDFGIEPLQQKLKELDEETYSEIDIHNTQRIIRVLEVCIGTQQKFSSFKRKNNVQRNFTPIKIGLNILEEAKSVINYRNHNALQTVGYKEIFDFIDGKTTLNEAVDLIKLHTRQYAKRQLTFFNKHNDYNWFQPKEIKSIISFVDEVIK